MAGSLDRCLSAAVNIMKRPRFVKEIPPMILLAKIDFSGIYNKATIRGGEG
jgi:hypothetical protein